MSKAENTFQVPEEMREMLDRGVTQAREGFDKVMKAADAAVSTLDQKAGSAKDQALDLHKKTISYTEQNVAAAFDLAANLVKASNIEEVMKLQTEYMTKQFATLRGQIQEAGQAVQEQAKAAASEFTAEAQKMQTQAQHMQAQAKDAMEKGVAAIKDAASSASKPAAKGKKG